MKKLDDLITTPERHTIFNTIRAFTETFTTAELENKLQEQGERINIVNIQYILRALCLRGYLEKFPIKTSTTRGRSTLHFKNCNR